MSTHQAPALLSALRQQAQAQADHPAVADGARACSYGALWQGALRFASQVQAHLHGDVTSQVPHLALVMDNSADYAAAVYGTWAAGGVVVGLNTSLKPEDLVWQIQHSQAKVVVLGSRYQALADKLVGLGVLAFHMTEMVLAPHGPLPEVPQPQPQPNLPISEPSADAPAAIIYTSGTTGAPKGVVLTHGNLSANAASICQALPLRADDVALCLLPFFYAYGFSVLHSHLSMGATLVLEHSMMYPQKVLQRMHEVRATAFYGVPSTYYLLLEREHLAHAASNGWLSTLRYCAQAGGAMDPQRIDKVCALLPQAGFFVMYGQTEASSRLTTLPAQARALRPGSVGCAIAGVELSIRSAEDGQPLPTGQPGEVCARGPNVMQGYWQAPEDTAQALREGWLWTGDLGYLDDAGYLFLTGRSRELIKTGAHRVSPWEIEQLIQSVDGVQEAAVVSAPDQLLGEVIQACVLAQPTADHDDLRRRIMQSCKARLAPYKVPKYLVFVDELPRTASGKVRKHLLPIHLQAGASPAS